MRNKLYQIFIGHKDKDTLNYKDAFATIFSALEDYLKNEKIAFSKEDLAGGYVADERTYIFENSTCYSFIGKYPKRRVVNLLKVLKEEFNQDSILLTITKVESEYQSYEQTK